MELTTYKVFTQNQIYTIEATHFSNDDNGITFFDDNRFSTKAVGFVPLVSLDFIQIAPPKQSQETKDD